MRIVSVIYIYIYIYYYIVAVTIKTSDYDIFRLHTSILLFKNHFASWQLINHVIFPSPWTYSTHFGPSLCSIRVASVLSISKCRGPKRQVSCFSLGQLGFMVEISIVKWGYKTNKHNFWGPFRGMTLGFNISPESMLVGLVVPICNSSGHVQMGPWITTPGVAEFCVTIHQPDIFSQFDHDLSNPNHHLSWICFPCYRNVIRILIIRFRTYIHIYLYIYNVLVSIQFICRDRWSKINPFQIFQSWEVIGVWLRWCPIAF